MESRRPSNIPGGFVDIFLIGHRKGFSESDSSWQAGLGLEMTFEKKASSCATCHHERID